MTAPAEPRPFTNWPSFITAGTSFRIDRAFRDFNNTDWAYSLIFAGAVVANISGSQITPDPNDGALFHVVLAPTDTQPLNPTGAGASVPFTYVERLTAASDGEIFDVNSGRIMVEPNMALATPGAAVSYEEKTLSVLEAALQGRLTSDIEHYSVAGRSVSKIPVQELLRLRGVFRALVWKQRNPGKIGQTVDVSLPSMGYGPYPRGRPLILP
jgi:hypothetical protein